MNDLVTATPGREMTVSDLRTQVDLIRDAMKSVMVEGMHYGTIPGCGDKNALFQPGAHKLGLLFNLAPDYRMEINNLPGGHREYEIVCVLTRRSDGMFIGQGVGVCSTMESKYRYRSENTGALVPKEYWDTRDKSLLGGETFTAKKMDGKWFICQRVEHDNPADYYNTVKKIAKKRAYNDAILTATAASDIFVPDDDVPDEFINGDNEAEQAKPVQQPQRKSASNGNGQATVQGAATDKQRKMIYAKLKSAGIGTQLFEDEFGKLDDLQFANVNPALEWITKFEQPEGAPY